MPMLKSFRLALGFLSIFPVSPAESKPGDLSRAAVWFPWVGLNLGCALILVWWISSRLFPALVAAALTVAAWALLTGAIHLDGVADCGDGLFVSAVPARRLEIMRDPHVGTFGVLSLVILLLLKIFALAALPQSIASYIALLLAPILGRWLILVVARQPLARTDGMGAEFSRNLRRRTILFSAGLPLICIALGGERALIATLATAFATAGLTLAAHRRLGGITGDVLGLSVELTEVVVLLVYAVNVLP